MVSQVCLCLPVCVSVCLSVCVSVCLSVCLCSLTHHVDEGAAEDSVEAAEHRVGDPPSEHGHEVARTCGRENIQMGHKN